MKGRKGNPETKYLQGGESQGRTFQYGSADS